MDRWDAFASVEPEMAEKGRALLYQRGDGEGLIATVARNGIPRTIREPAAASWFFTVEESYPLYELLIDHAVLGERASADEWPPTYRVWRSAG